MLFSDLPWNLQIEVFSFLGPETSMGPATSVSKAWYLLAQQVSYSLFVTCHGAAIAENAKAAVFWRQYASQSTVVCFGSKTSLLNRANNPKKGIFTLSLRNLLSELTDPAQKKLLAQLVTHPKTYAALNLKFPMTVIHSVQNGSDSDTPILLNPYFYCRYWWVTDTSCTPLDEKPSWDFLDRKKAQERKSLQLKLATGDENWPQENHGFLVDWQKIKIPPVYKSDAHQARYHAGCAIPASAIVGFFAKQRVPDKKAEQLFQANPAYLCFGTAATLARSPDSADSGDSVDAAASAKPGNSGPIFSKCGT